MKIAMLSIHSCPVGKVGSENTGGMSVYIRELARELGRRDHSVDVYTRIHEPVHDQVIELSENVRVVHLKAGKEEIDKLAIRYHLDDFARELENFRERNGLQYDLIHSHYWLSGLAGKRLQRWWSVPHVVGFHTLGAVKNAICVGNDEPKLRIDAEKEVVENCHLVIASTRNEKEDLIHYYGADPETVSVIPCGVNLDLFRPIKREIARCQLGLNGETIILFVGRIVPLKGIDNLLKAVAYLGLKRRVKLVVVGGDEDSQAEKQRLERLSLSLKIQDSVLFLGLVRQEMLPFFYSGADLCVVPSYYESFGLVVLESLACGTPVVATKVGGAESVIRHGETGYVVTDNDPHRLAGKIAQVLSTSNGNIAFVDSVRASVTKYGWSNMTEAMIKEYQRVLASFYKGMRRSKETMGLR